MSEISEAFCHLTVIANTCCPTIIAAAHAIYFYHDNGMEDEQVATELRALNDLIKEVAATEAAVKQAHENKQERAYDHRHELLMEGGGGPTLLEQQAMARKFK